MLLAGKRAVVTAAAGSGIGFATAERLAQEGAHVLLSDRHERRLGEAVDRLTSAGCRADGAVCDVTGKDAFEALFDSAVETLGGIDVLVNNAGLGHDARVHEMRDEDWNRVLDLSLGATFRSLRAALPRMASGASIVNVGSVTAHRAEKGQSAYAAAKAGVAALTRCVAIEAAEFGIRVNAVEPTLSRHAFLERAADASHLAAMEALQPQGRASEPFEVASVVAFLASDLASYLTGECLSVSAQKP